MYTTGTEMPPSRTAPAVRPPTGRPGLSAVALVLGAIALSTSILVVGGVIGVAGLILGSVALARSRRTGLGRDRAVTAVVTSALAIVVSVLVAVFLLWYGHRTASCYHFHHLHQYQQCVSRLFSAG
ncbi:DUF4190 domain-containing protein [Streptacidiphilus albus]|uniref:DUF4190 domain-containing protein n=1 Tax=Streptacidiphilus albus TaxID=105425 RepID=UPI000B1B294A|nr:DUF4190 domain-containing protein [Streptacidiphilus albus]